MAKYKYSATEKAQVKRYYNKLKSKLRKAESEVKQLKKAKKEIEATSFV